MVVAVALCIYASTANDRVFAEGKGDATSSSAIFSKADRIETDEQIELYINEQLPLSQFFTTVPTNIVIHDPEMLSISSNTFQPKTTGVTYLSYTVSERENDGTVKQVLKNRNVIIYDGARYVKQSGFSASQTFYVGESYSLKPTTSSACENSTLSIQLSSDSILEGTDTYSAEDFIEMTEDKTSFKVVGIGNAKIKIRSRTNKFDSGIIININSVFQDSDVKNAVNNIINNDVITKTEFDSIKTLSFNKLKSLNEPKLLSICQNITSINYNLENAYMTSDLTISSEGYIRDKDGKDIKANIAYSFSNLKNVSSGAYAIVANQRDNLVLSFANFNLQNKNIALDLSKASNTKLCFKGTCYFHGANVDQNYSRIYGIKAQTIEELKLCKNSNVIITGGNGSSSSYGSNKSGYRDGGEGLRTEKLTIWGEEGTLKIIGGNGGSGCAKGESGGNGGVAFTSNSDVLLNGSGRVTMQGGNGGKGQKGADGNDGPKGVVGWDSKGKNGESGTDGGKGGNGGNGAFGLICENLYVKGSFNVNLVGGNAGAGGAGGAGGKGGDGGYANWQGWDDNVIVEPGYIHGLNGGNGGDGGDGGSAGNNASAKNAAVVLQNSGAILVEKEGQTASAGIGGKAGDGGEAGKCKYIRYIIVWMYNEDKNGSSGKSGSSGKNGYFCYRGHKYSVISSSTSWENANKEAKKLGGHLATITSKEENAALKTLVQSSGINVWIGATDKDKEGTWKWVTGEEFSFSNWASGEPNDANSNEDYVGIYYDSYTWNDYDNENSGVKGYILEIE